MSTWENFDSFQIEINKQKNNFCLFFFFLFGLINHWVSLMSLLYPVQSICVSSLSVVEAFRYICFLFFFAITADLILTFYSRIFQYSLIFKSFEQNKKETDMMEDIILCDALMPIGSNQRSRNLLCTFLKFYRVSRVMFSRACIILITTYSL